MKSLIDKNIQVSNDQIDHYHRSLGQTSYRCFHRNDIQRSIVICVSTSMFIRSSAEQRKDQTLKTMLYVEFDDGPCRTARPLTL